ncbi:MAG: uridine kinase [Blastocatellia bacterium]|nr:uridine kinase [Chloracidobacterium sp.]MBL8185528.1 uridine kinase [Blastocatellia bacterium]HRJ88795.1 uridine kinase [Pyrinomonadaceae bacterium]HRK48932.1 uridine kinase [Pyrinomonadaceae bacterium]
MIIGICGGTGSGKTTIARSIVDAVGKTNVVLVEQDSYYRNLADMPLDERHQANFDHPDSIDSDMLVNHLIRLKQGLTVEMPLYDFVTHTRSDKIITIEPKPVVIVEGILIFAESRVLDLLDLRVFVDTPDDVRLIRRLRRDINERGRTFERTLEQYERTIRPMHFEFVEPSKRHADIIIPEAAQPGITVEVLCGLVRERLKEEKAAVIQ